MGTHVSTLSYTDNFRCLGSECKNTCCQYWEVNIDKETFEKYNKVENKKLREEIKKNISKYVIDATFKDYAKVKLDKRTKKCAFLNSNNLCTIHKRLGSDYLCLVCQVYPKRYNRFLDDIECSLALSCEEACRLALTTEDSMKTLTIDNKQTHKILLALDILSPEKASAIRYSRRYFLKVIDSNCYTLEQKLIIIGLLIQALKNNIETDIYGNDIIPLDAVTREIDAQFELLENKAFDLTSFCSNSDEFLSVNIDLLKEIMIFKPDYFTDGYNNYRMILFDFINYDEKNDILDFDILRYRTVCDNYFENFMTQSSFLLENYIKHYIYQSVFPFKDLRQSSGIFQEYLILIFNYFIIKTHLMSLFYKNGSVVSSEVINLVTCFCRNYENHFDYEDFILSLCQGNNITDVAKAFKLLG